MCKTRNGSGIICVMSLIPIKLGHIVHYVEGKIVELRDKQ